MSLLLVRTAMRRPAFVGLGVVGVLLTSGLLAPAIRTSFESSRKDQCKHNLTQIGLAFQAYHDAHFQFPPAAITDNDGTPLLSWRVALLPHLGHQDLYAQFHLDEPWDSPHNLALADQMPPVFACPSADAPPGTTPYQVVVGPDTPFLPDFQPVTIGDIIDGLAYTLIAAEAHSPVPWTSPHDMAFADGRPPLAAHHPGGFHALLGDGSARFLKSNIESATLRGLLTRNGGEVLGGGCE